MFELALKSFVSSPRSAKDLFLSLSSGITSMAQNMIVMLSIKLCLASTLPTLLCLCNKNYGKILRKIHKKSKSSFIFHKAVPFLWRIVGGKEVKAG